MASQTMSMRISEDIQEAFKAATLESGLKQEEFLVALLKNYQQASDQEESNLTQEKTQVRAGLERIRVLLEAVIDRASDQSRQAEESIKDREAEFKNKLAELQTDIQKKNETISALTAENKRLAENEESREMLRQAFQEKEKAAQMDIKSLQGRLKILESVVDEKNKLKTELEEYKEKMRNMELSHQKEINKIMESESKKLQDFILAYQDKK